MGWIFSGAMIAIVFVILWFILRSCTAEQVHEETYVYRIGRDPSWSSLNLMGNELSMTAFTSDLLSAIARKVHFKYSLYDGHSNELFANLDRGNYDAIMTSVEPNPLLFALYDLSDSFYLTGPVIIVRKDSDITSFEQLNDKFVGIKRSSPHLFHIREYSTIYFRTFENIHEAMDQLVNDQIDAVLMDALPAYIAVSTFYQNELKVVGKPLTEDGLRLIAKRTPITESLIKRFNEGLEAIIHDGTYNELIQKWDLVDTLRE